MPSTPAPTKLLRPPQMLSQPAPPIGGACEKQSDALFHAVASGPAAVAKHICLSHCKVLDACRVYAGKYRWLHTVVAGEHWVMRDRGGKRELVVTDARPTRDGCPICTGTPWPDTTAEDGD